MFRSTFAWGSLLSLAVVATACAGGGRERAITPAPTPAPATSSPPSTVAPAPPSTPVPASVSETAAAPAPTTVAAVPAETPVTPPPTAPAASAIVLRADGLGVATFGAEAESVIATASGVLGPATSDSGWIAAFDSPFGVCPGEQVRGVSWGDLLLLFGDETIVAAGQRHLFAFVYGPGANPAGLVTAEGIGLGATMAQVQAAYPQAEQYSDEFLGTGFVVGAAGLAGVLDMPGETGIVKSISGGALCGV